MRNILALPAQLAAFIFAASSAHAFSFEQAQPADLDISQLGRVGVAGDFDAVSLYQWVGQSQGSSSSNGGSSLLSRYPNGAFANLHESDGTIAATCPFVHRDGRLAGVILGGNFTSVGGVAANGVALFNATTGLIQPLPGLSGSVNALYCDTEGDRVWVGGSFSGGNSSNAISWVTGWTNLPFAGFNGPVHSISKASNGNIIFGGNFDGLGNTTSPQVRDLQVVPLSSAEVTGIATTTTQEGFSDPRNIICKTGEQDGAGNSWLLADNAAGAWDAQFRFGFIPTKLRLYNTNQQGRGTRTWRFTAQPINGIMNFSYVDPTDGQERYCDARCPLPENNQTAQDFKFVNAVGMDKFRIDISEWYGAGAGLAGIVLFQDDVYSFAINDFNEGQCDGVSTGNTASTRTGPWTVTPSHQSNSEYLTAQLPEGPVSEETTNIVFQPNIKQTGNYSITIFTPGCIGDGTCATRGRVTVTAQLSSGSGTTPAEPVTTEIWQTNNFDKYDEIYVGRIEAISGSFRPSITLAPAAGQNGPLTVVAQKVRSNLRVSTGGLNGLYEYNPNSATVQDNFETSAINRAGIALGDSTTITALAAQGDTIFVAGNFTGPDTASIFSITNSVNDLGEGGLNDAVSSLTLNDSALFIAGAFTGTRQGSTEGLSGVASYNLSTNRWVPLGAGVNGAAQYAVPLQMNLTAGSDEPELAIAFSGSFDRINAFGNNSESTVSGFAVWIPSRGNWLQNLDDVQSLYLQGSISAGTLVPGNPPVYAGRVSSFTLGASGAFELVDSGNAIAGFPASITRTQAQSSSSAAAKVKRAVVGNSTDGVVAGLFYREGDFNLTIYGGHFTATATNGSTITNLAIVDGSNNDAISGFASGIDEGSVVAAVGASGTSLFAGGSLTGNVNGRAVNGIVVYDLQTNDYAAAQPASLQGSSSITVNAIAPQPSTDLIYVGGNFESAGSFNCPALCVYDLSRNQWISPGGASLAGSVVSMAWVSDSQLAIVGNLTAGGNSSSVFIYDSRADSGTFTSIDGPTGTLTAITAGSSDGTQYWVGGNNEDGSPLLQKYNGTWTSIEPSLEAGSVIQGLQVFSTSRDHGRSDLLARNHVLMVLGQLSVPDFGNASAAIFNGTAWTPYTLTGASSGSSGGSLRNIFVENPANFFRSGRKFLSPPSLIHSLHSLTLVSTGNYLAIGFVILIGLAIALALIFLLVLLGLIMERYRRKRDGYVRAPQTIPQDKFQNMERVPPEHLFGSMNPNSRPTL
jgi:hypothetical protein